jgi:putative ABC transport system ATP-binding protein
MDTIIEVQNLNFSFGSGELKNQVLKGVNLQINEGEIVIMTGPSGSGKTTLLTIIGALRAAAEGSVQVFGHELVGAGEETYNQTRLNIGYIFQNNNLLESLSALENVCMSLELREDYNEERRRRLGTEILSAVGLGDRLHYKPGKLSGGQKQRVSIARALVANPKLILADEPTASLDKVTGQDAVNILQRLAREQGAAILLVTHDYRILNMADRIIELEDGRIR